MGLYTSPDVQPLSAALGECLWNYDSSYRVYVVNDIPGEDHIFGMDKTNKPVFDMLVSAARKFAFVWYYLSPTKGFTLVNQLKKITLLSDRDFVVKYPNLPVPKDKMGWPTIIRYGKHPAGQQLEKFITKKGNPALEHKIYSEEDLATYRNYQWFKVPGAMSKILEVSKRMVVKRLGKNASKVKNIRGYILYAGCAYSKAFPELGFGMRDIDVEILFSPEWFTNTRCAYTWECGIEEFGTPAYFGGKTRWLDLMYNSMHQETGNLKQDLLVYLDEMRRKSDRWATMSQRPMYDLETGKLLYTPNWIRTLSKTLTLMEIK
jgi:hypothetical protein